MFAALAVVTLWQEQRAGKVSVVGPVAASETLLKLIFP